MLNDGHFVRMNILLVVPQLTSYMMLWDTRDVTRLFTSQADNPMGGKIIIASKVMVNNLEQWDIAWFF